MTFRINLFNPVIFVYQSDKIRQQLVSFLLSLDPALFSTPQGIREVSEAVTHARFVGTNSSNDEVVLMRIIRVCFSLLAIKICVLCVCISLSM